MLANRFRQCALSLSVAAFAVCTAFAAAVPASADDVTAAAARAPQAKRSTTSFGNTLPSSIGGVTQPRSSTAGFLVFPGGQPGMNIGGRVNVGKSHVYVPYYGNISTDPTRPGVQGVTGLAYGFRTWDISVLNGGFGTTQAPVPGIEQPKVNPALSLSIRF
jgi:hypothetical protein